jgi:iron complex outermembrane receptor protein
MPKVFFRSLLLLSASALASTAAAQTAAAPQSNSTAIAEVVVTAQRRSENLQNVPVSVTAVSADALERRGVNDLNSVVLLAPSLQVSNDNKFSVRGVGTQGFSSSIESSVAFALDEVNLTNPSLNSGFFDVAQVEVLNGPQGLLFGRNASAGLLNVTTVRPRLGETSGRIDVEGDYRDTAPGNAKGVVLRGAVNLPAGENLAFRLSGLYDNQDPLVTFKGPKTSRTELGQERWALRGKALYQPTDALTLEASADYGEEHGALGFFDTTYRQLSPGSVNAAPLAQVGITAGPENTDLAGDAGYYRDLTRRGVQGKISYLLGNGVEISNIAAWKNFDRVQQIDQDGTAQNGANINYGNASFDQYSNELRIALPAGNRLTGQVGLYAFRSVLDSRSQIAGNNYVPGFVASTFPFCVGAVATPGAFPPTCAVSNTAFLGNDHVVHQTNESYAAFGQFTYKATDNLQLIAGGRVTKDELSIRLVQNTDKYFVTLGIPFQGAESYDNTNFSWKLGAQYNVTSSAMVYATYGKGYKGPGFNDNAVSATGSLVVQPETNKNLELGAKTSWLDRRLIVNLSAFQSRFSNYQAQSFDLTTSSFIIQNAATLKSKGVEATVTARPSRGLTINASGTYLDSAFGDFPGAQCYPTQGCSTFNANGRTPPMSPKFTGTLDFDYEFDARGSLRPFVSANLYHRSSVQFNIAPSPGTVSGAQDLLGFNVGVRGETWRASVFCKNCTDKRVPLSIGVETADSFAGMTSYVQHFGLNSFRTIGVQLGAEF